MPLILREKVVHISAGISALAAAVVVGKEKDVRSIRQNHMKSLDRKTMLQNSNQPTSLMCCSVQLFALVSFVRFNAGSALAANGLGFVSALVVTNLAAAAASISWMLADWVIKGKPSAVGIAAGAVVGLVAITPASGYVNVPSALIIGLAAGVICNLVANWRAGRSRIDDALDVFACHGVGGIWGSIATGIFASAAITAQGGLIFGNVHQFLAQLAAIGIVVRFILWFLCAAKTGECVFALCSWWSRRSLFNFG